jgi:molybdenum cofactor biosynthesis protein B
MPVHDHKTNAVRSVRCAVLTVSDTRTMDDDTSGRRIAELLTTAGHVVGSHDIVRDEPDIIAARVRGLVDGGDVGAAILSGGTGIAARDSTIEAVRPLLEKELPGFGELFRYLSYQDIGPAAMLSRATAGAVGGLVVIVLPGSTAAVELAMSRLVLPELGHMVSLAGGQR